MDLWKPNTCYLSGDSRGGPASSWEIDLCSLQLHGVSIRGCVDSRVEWDLEGCQRGRRLEPCVTIINGMKQMSANLDEADSCCMRNKCRSSIATTPGSPVPSQLARKFGTAHDLVYCYSPNDQCLCASSVNVVYVLNVEKLAKKLLSKWAAVCNKIRSAINWFQRHAGQLMLRNVLVPVGVNTVDWLQLQLEGVRVARLHGIDSQREQIDYSVTVDAKPRRGWDPAGKCGLRSEPYIYRSFSLERRCL